MKKTIALLSSLLVFAGIKAQINPTIKKETVNPGLTRPGVNADSLKAIKGSFNQVKLTKQSPADSLKALNEVPLFGFEKQSIDYLRKACNQRKVK